VIEHHEEAFARVCEIAGNEADASVLVEQPELYIILLRYIAAYHYKAEKGQPSRNRTQYCYDPRSPRYTP
jgi:hypothetical protein